MARQRSLEFGRRFRELTAGKTQMEVADELQVGQATVSNMKAGWPPGLEILERIITRYRVERSEWMELAGLGGVDPDERRLNQIAARAANQTVDELFRRGLVAVGVENDTQQEETVEEILGRGLLRAKEIDPEWQAVDFFGKDRDRLTVDDAKQIVRTWLDLAREAEEGR